jgi:hypothetical protein
MSMGRSGCVGELPSPMTEPPRRRPSKARALSKAVSDQLVTPKASS